LSFESYLNHCLQVRFDVGLHKQFLWSTSINYNKDLCLDRNSQQSPSSTTVSENTKKLKFSLQEIFFPSGWLVVGLLFYQFAVYCLHIYSQEFLMQSKDSNFSLCYKNFFPPFFFKMAKWYSWLSTRHPSW